MEDPIAFLNGRIVRQPQLSVPINDTGFVMGTTVAEQMRTFNGVLFRVEEHLDRLAQSLWLLGIDPGLSMDDLAHITGDVASRNHRLVIPGDDLGVSVFVTPGPYASYAGSDSLRPMVCVHTYPLPFRLWAEKYRTGQALAVSSVRQVPPTCWSPELKCRSRMHYFLADRQVASVHPGARALLLDQEGLVTEASTANILVYRQAEGLLSPPREKVLRGISLAVVTELATELGIAVQCRDLRPEEVATADEVMLTSSPFCLQPVTQFDGRPVADGQPGPIFGRLLAAWSARTGVDIAAQAARFANRTPEGR